ncbi:MAG: prolyl oligopeptidase family serine peptidase [Flavobacterium sp.]|jgi:prolyl oligopeptidase
MKALLKFTLLFLFSINIFSQAPKSIKKNGTILSKHGISYNDEYSWLENISENEVVNWVNSENKISSDYLKKVADSDNFEFKIKDYDYLSTNGLPVKKGRYFYSNYRLDKNKPPVLHYREKLNDSPKELVNPYRLFKNENAFIADYYPSKNSKYLAFKISLDGSDRNQIHFVNIQKQEKTEDILDNIKFSNLTWNEDSGIFYKKNSNQNVFAKDSTYQLYYHVLGNKQDQDRLVFDATETESSFYFFTKGNKLFLIETNKEETSENYYYALLDDPTFKLTKFIENDKSNLKILKCQNNRIYYSSNKTDWGDIRYFNIDNPSEEVKLIPQLYSNLLIDTDFLTDYIVCKYKALGRNYINIHDNEGKFIRKFEAPMQMDFSIRFYDSKTKDLFVTFYSNTISFLNYRLNIETGETNVYYNDYIRPKPTLFPFDHFETKTITYKSRDNKNIPITIIYKKGLELNGDNPTLLKAYGGFGAVSGANYDTGLLHFLEKGGVYAFASIRGGGENGRKWHRDGKGLNKMNSYNDFIDAAEFLIKEKYTSSNKLAITGVSNGGLVVGVALTQRPDLFKVAVPRVGAYDMVKFDQYTVGRFHLDEYGNPEVKEEFESLLGYSPYHNIKEDVNYPTTLIITSENDDRVPPIHSYKFAAKLKNRSAQKNAIYLNVLSNSGHYGKVTYSNHVIREAEFYSFIWDELNK